jgi:hypothetical protein
VVNAIRQWGDRWAAPSGPQVELRHEGCGQVVNAVSTCSHRGEELDALEVSAVPGRGSSPAEFERIALDGIFARLS